MYKKTEPSGEVDSNEPLGARERMKATLTKLQALKSRISELRVQCEELQRSNDEDRSGALLCDACGEAIDLGDEVEAKNFGDKALHYHKECFRKLWL